MPPTRDTVAALAQSLAIKRHEILFAVSCSDRVSRDERHHPTMSAYLVEMLADLDKVMAQ